MTNRTLGFVNAPVVGQALVEALIDATVDVAIYDRRRQAMAAVLRRAGIDFALPRGVLVRGRVTEARSGRPVAGALVIYSQRRKDNPFYRPQDSTPTPRPKAGPDGSFSLAVPPGPGHLLVLGPTPDYVHVETTDGDLDEGVPGRSRCYPDALVALDIVGQYLLTLSDLIKELKAFSRQYLAA